MMRESGSFGGLCAFASYLLSISLLSPLALAADSSSSNDSLVWGPYRPNVYFGVRPKIPDTLLTGLMWAHVQDFHTVQNSFRHTCEQNEGMAGYGWEEYDIRTGGKQTIHDAENFLDITTQFVKVPGGSHGGNWGVRVNGAVRKGAPKEDVVSTILFYMGVEGMADGRGSLQLVTPYKNLGYDGPVKFKGESEALGEYTIEVTRGPTLNQYPKKQHKVWDERPSDRTMVQSANVPEIAIWQAKALMFQFMKQTVDDYGSRFNDQNSPPPWNAFTIGTSSPVAGNFHLVQKVFKNSFQFDILFSSGSSPKPMNSERLTDALKESSSGFDRKFKEVFKGTGEFAKDKYREFSRSLFSNLLGGVAYLYGEEVIDRSYAPEYDEENEGFWEEAAEARGHGNPQPEGPFELFTAVPSRPFFPRGFLWDEGFHLLPILEWDLGVALEILRSWFNTMDEDGWIAREQIPGNEARSKVPPEFAVQYPHYANPPTLFLAVDKAIEKLNSGSLPSEDKETMTETLKSFYPLMRRNYDWYRRTQRGDLKSYDRQAYSTKEGYRWKGRTPAHILTSGLDDYPRAQPPHPGELHVDLISWMGMMSNCLERVAKFLGESDDAKEYASHSDAIGHNINDLHWDEKQQTYCDATIDEYEESSLVCHKGYISLMPFLVGLMGPEHPHLGAVLDLIGDSEELWSHHGIRSLSKKDPFYGTEENYWRSPVWMNMNYLVTENLLLTARSKGPHKAKATKLYNELRTNLVETVYKSWKETGFAWEQYNPDTGAGQRTQHFTGWTTLVVKIMCMPDLSKGSSHEEL